MSDAAPNSSMPENDRQKLLKGEAIIKTLFLDDGIIDTSGSIFVAAPPETVWSVLTDYDHLSESIPKVVESKVIEEKSDEKILEQTGKSGILFFEKSVHIVLRVKEIFPRSLTFNIIEGDFKIYRGQWKFEPSDSDDGTFLSWKAVLKPDFFAPPLLVSFVQHQDLPTILETIKNLAETRKPNPEI
ncbi:SRPBCC family protein [Prosthecochloris sp. SCSIO W1103]|uniref:SRPBCC family protein n=1 Tax=Prosthecochloris sp. SCSIO W1103 TaxID=2992244 RepID=UPI00223DC470|nr:SRPBCC family protein [Prosthecochloris sp. SCSIO W1103]UZJ37014.1 SRPBCC family protein [Prosthecochloris sp. SCSIO W1103]